MQPHPNRAELSRGERRTSDLLTWTHRLHLLCPPSVSPAPLPPSPSLISPCLEYDELQPAGKPGAGDSVPAGAHHHRPEPTESNPDPTLADRRAGPAGGRAYRGEQAPAGHQGTTASSLPSPPSPSPRPQLPSSPSPSSGPPTQDCRRVSARPCDSSSTSRDCSGGPAVAIPNYGPRGHAAGSSRPVHGFPGRK